jgi:hypothetical protein
MQSTDVSPIDAGQKQPPPQPKTGEHVQRTCTLALATIVIAGSFALFLTSPSRAAAANCAQMGTARSATAKGFMVAAAHPLAAKAGCDTLSAGGTAIDAAVAVQAVLSAVEPHASRRQLIRARHTQYVLPDIAQDQIR